MTKQIFKLGKWLLLIVAALVLNGCLQGAPSEKPPIHINPNMDDQPKYEAYEKSEFFENGAAMRVPVAGTVARGDLRADEAYFTGKEGPESFVKQNPLQITAELLERGHQRYNIYCTPCHGAAGDGKGIVPKRGFLPPPSFHQDNVRAYDDGYIYEVISNGIRNMPGYKKQIRVEDRWAIVAFVRVLQRTQNATAQDVPEEILKDLN